MPDISTKNTGNPKKLLVNFIYSLACFCFLVFTGCEQKPNNSSSAAGFKKALEVGSKIYFNKDHVKGLRIIDSAVSKYKDISVADRFEVYRLHCDYYVNIVGDNDRGLLYADSLLMVLDNSGHPEAYPKQYGIAYFSLGDVAFNKQKYIEAYQYYYRGKVIGRNSLNSCTLGDYSYRLGMVMYKQEHFSLAADYFRQSFMESKSCDDDFATFYRQQELLDNAALSYYKAGITDTAGIYYKKALDFIDAEGGKYPEKKGMIEVAKGVVYGNQAQLFMIQKDYGKAANLLKKSFAINLKKDNDNRDAELTELKLAHIYVEQKAADSLYFLLQNIRRQLDTIKNPDAEVDWSHLMANYYQSKSNLKEALLYFNKYAQLKDSSDVAKHKLLEIDASQQFKDFENQSTINKLKTDNGMQHIYLTVAIICAAMALIIVLLVYTNWKKTKNNVLALSDLNKKIHEQNESLQRAFLNLELNDKEKDRILRAVAHDLRNPIAGIGSLTALLLSEADVDGEQKDLLELIKLATNNSLELIREILEATGTIGEKITKKEMVEINLLVSNSIDLLRFKAAEKNQRIVFEALDTPEELYISREKIWRVMSNLISNAIKFSPRGAEILVKVGHRDDNILISVKDHGIGIPAEMKQTVFNMFTEAKRPGTIGEPSFGLGLSISKQIVESHGGEIWFESVPGKGTTFYVLLKELAKQPGGELIHQ